MRAILLVACLLTLAIAGIAMAKEAAIPRAWVGGNGPETALLDWTVEYARTPGGWYCEVVYDAAGNLHASHAAGSTGEVIYSVRSPDGTWTSELVGMSGANDEFTGIHLAADGTPHIAWYDSANRNLHYAVRTAPNTWEDEVVPNTGNGGDACRITLDPDGNPWIIYLSYLSGALECSYKSGGTWYMEAVQAFYDGAFPWPAIEWHPDGYPVVAFTSQAMGMGGTIYFASRETGSWVLSEIATDAHDNGWACVDMVVGGDGSLYVIYPSYEDGYSPYAVLASNTGAGWVLEDTVPYLMSAPMGSIDLDANGNPVMGITRYWDDLVTFGIGYVSKVAGVWEIEMADPDTVIGAMAGVHISVEGGGARVSGDIAIGYWGSDTDQLDEETMRVALGSAGGPVCVEFCYATDRFNNNGWTGFSLPNEPDGCSSAYASDFFGEDVDNRVLRWAPGYGFEYFPDDFEDLEVGRGYMLYGGATAQNPLCYDGMNPLTLQGSHSVILSVGFNLIGPPADKDWYAFDDPGGLYVTYNNETRTAEADFNAGDPFVNWNWIYWNPYTQSYQIMDPEGGGDDDAIHAGYAYWVYSHRDQVTLTFGP